MPVAIRQLFPIGAKKKSTMFIALAILVTSSYPESILGRARN